MTDQSDAAILQTLMPLAGTLLITIAAVYALEHSGPIASFATIGVLGTAASLVYLSHGKRSVVEQLITKTVCGGDDDE